MSNFSANLANVATVICSEACASGEITLTSINTLNRTYALLDNSARVSAKATMQAVKDGGVKVINDGGGVFDRNGMRVKGT